LQKARAILEECRDKSRTQSACAGFLLVDHEHLVLK
jgi:hypothetical protein